MNWDLSKLYKKGLEDEALLADFESAEQEAGALAEALRAADPAKADAAQLKEFLKRSEAVFDKLVKSSSFVFLVLSTNGTNEQALRLMAKADSSEMAFTAAGSAFSTYMGKVSGLESIIGADPQLSQYAFYLKEAAQDARHVVDPALEPTVLKLRMSGSSAWSKLRDMLDATHMVEIELDGEQKQIPLSAARNLAYSPDAQTRKKGYEAELASYPKMEQAMCACLNGLKGEALTMFDLKKYDGPLHQTLDGYRMDRQTLDALLAAMNESLPAFRRFFRAKARALGHSGGLPFYDLFAPMGASDTQFTLEEARAYLLRVLGQFSKKMADFVDQAFENRWIDAYPKEGKGGGAFCSSIHSEQMSYILANFGGSLSDVSTLAHELGHAYHNECLKDVSALNSNPPMPLAETASIFNETLLSKTALKTAGPQEELMLLDAELTDAAQVVVDILSRYLFEAEVFARRADHSLTVSELKEIMLDAQRKTYGDGLDENLMHPYMWACKSHYYRPDTHFYNFPYAFGLLFGKGVYAQYEAQGEAFLPVYDALLKRTGSDTITNVAASVGIDVTSVDFWRTSVAQVVSQIDRFEQLVNSSH